MPPAARAYAWGDAEAQALVLADALSFWGGVDLESGRIIDRSHPDCGRIITATILVMPGGRGSSSSSSVLAECLRRGTGPAALVLGTPDPILTTGALVADTLYGIRCPVVVCALDGITTGMTLRVTADRVRGATVARVP